MAVPIPLIVDTDMSFDVDDVGALAVAHALADRGEVEIIATVHDAGTPKGIGAINVINGYYGRGGTPLGAFKGAFGRESDGDGWVDGPYIEMLARKWPGGITNSAQVSDAVDTYRRVLATADDHSVVIAALGFLTNLAGLLASPPDHRSPLSGYDLVARKVRRVAYQGGCSGGNFNWDCGGPWYQHDPHDGCSGVAAPVVNGMPPNVEQRFSDLGDNVWTGWSLANCAPVISPVRAAYIRYLGKGNSRPSWDAVSLLLAVREVDGLTQVTRPEHNLFKYTPGNNTVLWDGHNLWTPFSPGDARTHAVPSQTPSHQCLFFHSHLEVEETAARRVLQREIETLMCRPPLLNEPQQAGFAQYHAAFAQLNSPEPPPPPRPPPIPPGRASPPPVDCGDCWHINEGDAGDCSSVAGCGSWLCDFCTNDSEGDGPRDSDDDDGDG